MTPSILYTSIFAFVIKNLTNVVICLSRSVFFKSTIERTIISSILVALLQISRSYACWAISYDWRIVQGWFFVVSWILNCQSEYSQLLRLVLIISIASLGMVTWPKYWGMFYWADQITISGNTFLITIILHDDDTHPSVRPSLTFMLTILSVIGHHRSLRPWLNGPPRGCKCATSNMFTHWWMSLAFPEAQKTSECNR